MIAGDLVGLMLTVTVHTRDTPLRFTNSSDASPVRPDAGSLDGALRLVQPSAA
jgi:hypothetical protein